MKHDPPNCDVTFPDDIEYLDDVVKESFLRHGTFQQELVSVR